MEAVMHPIKFLFDEINRDWGLETRDRNRKAKGEKATRRGLQNLGALLLMR
jgi:hypothetical protein